MSNSLSAHEDSAPKGGSEQFMRKAEILSRLNVSPATFDRWVRDGIFPKPQRIRNVRFWLRSVVEAWITNAGCAS